MEWATPTSTHIYTTFLLQVQHLTHTHTLTHAHTHTHILISFSWNPQLQWLHRIPLFLQTFIEPRRCRPPDQPQPNEKLCTVLVQSYLYYLIELCGKESTTDATSGWRGNGLDFTHTHTHTRSSCKGCALIRLWYVEPQTNVTEQRKALIDSVDLLGNLKTPWNRKQLWGIKKKRFCTL